MCGPVSETVVRCAGAVVYCPLVALVTIGILIAVDGQAGTDNLVERQTYVIERLFFVDIQ